MARRQRQLNKLKAERRTSSMPRKLQIKGLSGKRSERNYGRKNERFWKRRRKWREPEGKKKKGRLRQNKNEEKKRERHERERSLSGKKKENDNENEIENEIETEIGAYVIESAIGIAIEIKEIGQEIEIEIENERGIGIGIRTGMTDTAAMRTTLENIHQKTLKKQYLKQSFPKKKSSDLNRKL